MVRAVLAQHVTRPNDRAAVAGSARGSRPGQRYRSELGRPGWLVASFHFTRKFVSRGQGQSVVATAAYQSRSNLYNEQDGLQKNYTRQGEQELLESFIYAPKDAPEWVFDREKLWNAAEHAEDLHNKTREKSAITGQHIDLALPHELDPEQNRRLLQDFVRDNFTGKGLSAT